MNLIKWLICFSFVSGAWALTLEEERKYDELEGVAFIKALIADKKFEEVVVQFPSVSKKTSELGELHFHLGEAHYNLKEYQKAYDVLKKGEKYVKRPPYYALWARASSKLQRHADCAAFFKKVPAAEVEGADWEVSFDCLLKSGNSREALTLALNGALKDPDFFLMSQKTLISHGLETFAKGKRDQYLKECRTVGFYLRLWDLTNGPEVVEMAHACHPGAAEVTSIFVKAQFQEGKYHTVAHLFETLSREDQVYLKHAAEFYKVAGRDTVADYFFSMGDETDYILARSSHFLNEENYAALLAIPFRPEILAKNHDLSYAVAYSHFKFLSLEASAAAIRRSAKKNLRDQQLESLIEQCREMDWRCRP